MPSVAERPRSSQEALLRLEKNTDSPTAQLNEAASIIGLDLALCASHPQANRPVQAPKNAAPKEEWVLRWLLKKLKSGKNYRVEPVSFLLLRQLVDLIPPKNLATTLKDQKFLAILNDAVTDLEEAVLAAGEEDGTGFLGRSGSETSHTLSDSPRDSGSSRHEKKGTKRKRVHDGIDCAGGGDPMEVDSEQQLLSPTSCLLTFIRILYCLYSLVTLANKPLGIDEVATSHLKHALKGEPETVAVILSKSLQMAAVATVQLSQWQATAHLQHFLYVFPAVLDLWELRSSRRDDSENKPSNDCFAKYCLLHAMRLQLCVRSVDLSTDEKSQVLHAVERLIALHVMLPARAAFFDRGGSGIDYSTEEPDWSPVQPVTETFRPLFFDALGESTSNKKTACKTAELLPGFFDVATRSVPRDTFRRQTHEGPWLETLFVAVAELAFSIVKEESTSPAYVSDFVRILEQLFRVALERKVQLSLHTLFVHASYTGLLQDDPTLVEWNLTALLIKLGVDVFLPNSGLGNSDRLLNALLGKIISQWIRGSKCQDPEYEVIKNGVMIPLLRGFAAARDLPTFIQIWHGQLAAAAEIRSQNSALSLFTVWEDDDLCNTYGELVQTALTDAHLVEQFKLATTDIKTSGDGTIPDSPAVYGRIVILEAGLRKRVVNSGAAHEAITPVAEAVSITLSSEKHLHWRWRLWRLIRNLLKHNMRPVDSPLGAVTGSLVDVAAKSIQRLHRSSIEKQGALLECLEAYQFALVAVKDATFADRFDSLTGQVVQFIKSTASKYVSRTSESPWNGRIETLNSSLSLALGYFLALLRCPPVWHQMKPGTRFSLFEQMLSLAVSQYNQFPSGLNNIPAESRFLQAWVSLVCYEYLLNSPCIVSDLVSVLSDKVKHDTPGRKLYVESLQRIPAPLIRRRQRGILLDLLLDVLFSQTNHVEVIVGILSLMSKLADMPKSATAVTSGWESIWKIAKTISLQGTEIDLRIMKAFRSLHRTVVEKLIVLSEEERHKLFKKMYHSVSSKISKLKYIPGNSMVAFFLRISLTQLWTYRKDLSGAVDEAELAVCRQRMFELAAAEVKSVKDLCSKEKLQGAIPLIKVLDLLEDFEDLATDNSEIERHLTKIEGYIEKSDYVSDSSLRGLIRRRILACRGPEKSITLPVLQCAETLSLGQPYDQEQQFFIRAAIERFRSMTTESLGRVIKEMRETGGFTGENDEYRLLVVGLVAASLPPLEERESPIGKELSSLCTAITESLYRSNSIEHFSLATECLDMLLRYHTRCITQWNVDSLLASISVCASTSGPHINPEFAPTIYTRLCRLAGTLFNLHRQHLGGRFHLILPAMQRLLSCLFISPSTRKRHNNHNHNQPRPPWFLSSPPLTSSHAVHFTRLLTSLCDPTVSAVSRPSQSLASSHEGLTDQTKKAKRIAGQYLQYLIMEYAQCSLRSPLAPEVKAAILPGLYAVLGVMSRDTMRALNAGLDVSKRAIFKGLYDDYVRFGKWNKG